MVKVNVLICLLVLLCVGSAQADTITFQAYHMADGEWETTAGEGYNYLASAAIEQGAAGWDGSLYSTPWCGGDFSHDNSRMMPIRFGNLFGSGPIQIPVGATIISATLNLNVWDGYMTPPSAVRVFTGLTPWYSTFLAGAGGSDGDFSTALFRKYNAQEAWDDTDVGCIPRHGIDYTSTYTDVPVTGYTVGSGVFPIDVWISADVTADVTAYAAGTLDNNGWWLGANAYWVTSGMFRIGGANAGSILMPSLVVEYIPEPITLSLLGLGSLLALRRRK